MKPVSTNPKRSLEVSKIASVCSAHVGKGIFASLWPGSKTASSTPTVRAYFERVRRGDPQRKKIALVATAHYLVRVMWALLKRGTSWHEDPALAKTTGPASRGPAAEVGEGSQERKGGGLMNESA